jgi:hypothetical protein
MPRVEIGIRVTISFPATSGDHSVTAEANPLVIAPPANVANGDLLVAWVIARTGISSAPGSWTALQSFTTNGTFAAYSLKVPTASALPANWTWTPASARASVIIQRVTGTDLTASVTVGGTCGAGTDAGFGTTYSSFLPMQLPGITPPDAWAACVGTFFTGDANTPSADLVPGGTLLATATTTSAGAGRSSSGIYGAVAAGPTGTIVCANDWPGAPGGQDGILLGFTAVRAPVKSGLLMAGVI